LSVRNGSASGITAGGTFILTNGITLTANGSGVLCSNGTTITFNLPSGSSSTLNANCNAFSNVTGGTNLVTHSGSGTLTVNGNLSGGVATDVNYGVVAIRFSGTGILNANGSVIGGSSNNSSNNFGISVDSTGTLNFTGNVGGSNLQTAIRVNSSATVNITGNVIGCPSVAVINGSTGTVNIIGDVTHSSSSAVVNNSSGTLTHTGTANASASGPAIGAGSPSQNTYLTGPFIGTAQGVIANQAIRWRWIQSVGSSYMTVPNSTATGYKNLYTADSTLSNSGQPGISSVRSGTIYGPNSEFTGTLAMPLPSQVYYGVAVDNTTGTAALNVADIWNYPVSGITTSGSIGARLKNSATVNTVSQQISDAFSAK
jgi:hypothetical protein